MDNKILNYIHWDSTSKWSSCSWWAPFPACSEEWMRKWPNSRRKLDSGRNEEAAKALKKVHYNNSCTITVVCCTTYLSWVFSVIFCPHWLGSFIRRNYLRRSMGFTLCVLFCAGFIFRGSLHPTNNEIRWKCNFENLCPQKFAPAKICMSTVLNHIIKLQEDNQFYMYSICIFLAFG